MGVEIEKKFLLKNDSWRADVQRACDMDQGYLAGNEHASVRIRVEQGKARLNIKSATLGIERLEYDYEIPVSDAKEMLELLCNGKTISKTRHYATIGEHLWEIDEFKGSNRGLIVAEIELSHRDEKFKLPEWAGADVSEDPRYFNVQLVDHPWSQWPENH